MAAGKPFANIVICALARVHIALQQDWPDPTHLLRGAEGKRRRHWRIRGPKVVRTIRAAHYSGSLVSAAQNDFFATDENLIELR
jgi:hypothetical protein